MNTGIYDGAGGLDYVAAGESVDWSSDVFPQPWEGGKRVQATSPRATGSRMYPRAMAKAQADVLEGAKVDVELDGFEISPGVWVAEGPRWTRRRCSAGRCTSGTTPRSRPAEPASTVLGSTWSSPNAARSCTRRWSTTTWTSRAVQSNGGGCGRQEHRWLRAARIEDGAVTGTSAWSARSRSSGVNVRVYLFKTSRPAPSSTPRWGVAAGEHLFGVRGPGIPNVEITPELAA